MKGNHVLTCLLGLTAICLFEGRAQVEGSSPEADGTAGAEEVIDVYEEQLSQPVAAAKGRLVGRAYDAKSGKPMEGAGIQIEETGDLTITDAQGRFIIDEVEPGTYTIIISQSGYQPLRTENVEIRAGQVNTLSSAGGALERSPVAESNEIYEMEEIEVVAELVEEGMESQLFDRKELEQLMTSMGKAEFDKVGAGDVISAVGRMAGANVLDGKYAVIRGLADRYSNTTLNGALIPSGDPSKKAVQLDLIATHLLEKLDTYKTFTPDLTGEFAGGLVDIRTLKFPENFLLSISVGTEFDSESTNEEFLTNPDRSMDFLGRVSDAFPDGISGVTNFPEGVISSRTPPSAAQDQARGEWRTIHNQGGFFPDATDAPWNTSYSFALGNSIELARGKLGFVIAFDQSHKFETELGTEINRGSFTTGRFTTRQSQIQNVFTESIDWGGLGTLAYLSNDENHLLALTLMTNNSAADVVTQGRRVHDQEDGQFIAADGSEIPRIEQYQGKDARVYRAFDEIGYLGRSLDVAQFSGYHKLTGLKDLEVDYIVSLANAEEERPDQRHLKSFQVVYDDPALAGRPEANLAPERGTVFTQSNVFGGNPKNSFRTHGNTAESALFGQLGFILPVWEKNEDTGLKLKFGSSHFDRSRQVRGRLFAYDLSNDLRREVDNNDDFGQEFHDNFSSDDTINGTGLRRRGDGLFIKDFTAGGGEVRNVDAFSETTSAYVSSMLRFNGLRLTTGVRLESESRGYEILPGLNDPNIVSSGDQTNQYLLPAIALDYTFGDEDQFKLRASYGRTVARPTFYEFAPVKTIDQATGLQINGNQDLEDTLIDNFDVGFEWYPTPREMVALSLFYKEMESPIVTTVGLENGTTFFRSWQNSESGTIAGAELEMRKEFLDHWSIGANFTYIHSEIGPLVGAGGNTGSATVFEGQPEYIINLNLGYENPDIGLSANLVYNYTDDILTDVTSSMSVPNVFQKGIHSLDFFLAKDLGNGFKLKLGAENLLGSDFEKYYEGESLIYRAYTRPRTYSLSLGWTY